MLCQLTVINEIIIIPNPVIAYIHQLNTVLYAKLFSQILLLKNAIGDAIINANNIHLIKSLFNKTKILLTELPFPQQQIDALIVQANPLIGQ